MRSEAHAGTIVVDACFAEDQRFWELAMSPARVIGVLAILIPPGITVQRRFGHTPPSGDRQFARFTVCLAAEGEPVGFHLHKDYPFRPLVVDGDGRLAANGRAGTNMASGKKTSDHESLMAPRPAADLAGSDRAEIDDIPDRLLILANRLQRALGSRQIAVNAERPGPQDEMRQPVTRTEDEK